MYIFFNPNPVGKSTGDCVIRAVSKLLDMSWEQTYIELCLQGYITGDMPSSNHTWITYLKGKGFTKVMLPDTCPDCYTVADFAHDHNIGTYLLGTGDHTVCVKDGNWYDSWDSGSENPIYYFYKKR